MSSILAIETSCDETAAAVVAEGRDLLGQSLASQVDLHARFGGVVPEIASRSHQEVINAIIKEALESAKLGFADIDAVAVTQGPGLPGALMVGLATAKALAYAAGVPLIGVNHLEGHLYANYFEHEDLKPPFVALIVSGGHTLLVLVSEWGNYQVLGQTQDDAAGEAFDKVASYLDIGYPGGPIIERLAKDGDPEAIPFPRAMLHTKDFNFSLSGLKTAVLYYVRDEQERGAPLCLNDLAASFQAAVIDVQVSKTIRAAREFQVDTIVLAGGVAANDKLRVDLAKSSEHLGLSLYWPSPYLCTDNAIMIGAAAWPKFKHDDFLPLDCESLPNMAL